MLNRVKVRMLCLAGVKLKMLCLAEGQGQDVVLGMGQGQIVVLSRERLRSGSFVEQGLRSVCCTEEREVKVSFLY